MSQSKNIFLKSGDVLKFDAHKTPIFEVQTNIDWVIYGTDEYWANRYPDYLIHLYNSSAKNNAIINEKCTYTVGQGLSYSNANPKEDINNDAAANGFINEINKNKVYPRTVKDRSIQGGFANEVVYNKAGDKVTPHHLDFSNIRASKPVWNETDKKWDDPEYYYTEDWAANKPKENKDFTVFHPFKYEENKDKTKRYIIYYKDYRPDMGVYPLPEYIAAIPYIASDFEIGNFIYNNVKNGFSSGYLVNFFNGEPTEDQKKSIVTDFDEVLHGTDNAGKSIKSFNEDKDSAVEITPINPNGQDDRFINLNKSVRDEIYTGHGVDPVIVGLKGDSGWSNNADEKRAAIEGWQNGYIDGIQSIFEEYFTSLLNFNGITGEIVVLRKEPIALAMSEALMQAVLLEDEIREKFGYEPKPVVETTTTTTEMSKDDQLLAMFAECGTSDDELIEIDSRQIPLLGTEDAFNKESEYIQQFATKMEINILKMIISGVAFPDIQKAFNLDDAQFTQALTNLKEDGFLGEEDEPTEDGIDQAKEEEVFVVYKYAKRNDVSGTSIIDTTRDFCRDLVTQSRFKSWTLNDIRLMNNGMGLDVFTSRGGWKTIEGTNRHVPFCRHIWEQRLVTRKP